MDGDFNYESKQLPKDFIVCHCNYFLSSGTCPPWLGRPTSMNRHTPTYIHSGAQNGTSVVR